MIKLTREREITPYVQIRLNLFCRNALTTKLRELFGLFDEFSTGFEIVEPRKVKVE